MSSKFEFNNQKEKFINVFLFVVVIILLFINFVLIRDKNSIINNDEKVIASLEDDVNRNSILNFEYDGSVYDYPPSKEDYEIESTSCDNALGSWNDKEWELELSNIKGKVRCNILFRKKKITYSSMNTKKVTKKKNKKIKKVNQNIKENQDNQGEELLKESVEVNVSKENEEVSMNNEIFVEQPIKKSIKNTKYQINSEDNIKYIIGFEPKTKINDILNSFTNDLNNMYFYDNNDNLVTDYNSLITTGMAIKLKEEDNNLDQIFIVICGDINKDGIVNVTDYKKLNRYLNNLLEFSFIEEKAADVDSNGIIDNNDYEKLYDYIYKSIPSLN